MDFSFCFRETDRSSYGIFIKDFKGGIYMKKVLFTGAVILGGAVAVGFGAGLALTTVGVKKVRNLFKDGAEFINKCSKEEEDIEKEIKETKEKIQKEKEEIEKEIKETEEKIQKGKEDIEAKMQQIKEAFKETEEKIEKIVKNGEA
jgi:peptidoglycan hydrolase CwlO-like protein